MSGIQQMLLGTATGGGGGAPGEITGINWSQSSMYSGNPAFEATSSNMRDANTDASAGAATAAATNSGGDQWIMADLGAAHTVNKITVGGGNKTGWGNIAAYLNARDIQYSLDGATGWTTVATVSGVTDSMPLDKDFTFTGVSARYWRLLTTSGWLATATFRLYE